MSVTVSNFDHNGLRILAFDGGELNCMSQLKIVDEFMGRLRYDTGKAFRPCEYFHSISGVGASGVIAILLGILGLSVDETSSAFLQLYQETLLGQDASSHLRSSKLDVATRSLLQACGVPEEARLCGNLGRGAGCKVSLLCMSTVDMATCRILRSYDSRRSSYNATIIEAIKITWAIPGLFEPVQVGTGLMHEELISAVHGFNNPTLRVIQETHETFGASQPLSCLLSLGTGRTFARTMRAKRPELYQGMVQDAESTAESLNKRYSGLKVYFRLSVDNIHIHPATPSKALQEEIARINSLTSNYLETHDASEILDRCVQSSLQVSQVTIDHFYRTRANTSQSSHCLPPLSAFFVDRKQPMDAISSALKGEVIRGQRIGVVVGMGGSGKTQISLKYAYDKEDEYDHILFVDASSINSIQNGVLNRVRDLDRTLNPKTPKEAIQLLARPRGNISSNWLIIMDNADDIEIDLREMFPQCDFGTILITSRNATLGNLSPDGTIYLDVMTREEAVRLLLLTALGSVVRPSGHDREYAIEIVDLLGYLPIAIVQAGFYIRFQKCLPDYANRLQANRARLLRKPALVQRDVLRYDHSVYAAFDITLSVLSHRALQVLGIISFVHFTDFPLTLFGIAASYGFAYDPYHLLNRPREYRQTVEFLKGIFCPDGSWDEELLDGLLEELQKYSMVTLVQVESIVTLRLHPLMHAWAKDRLPPEHVVVFRAAAVRLLVCGMHPDNEYIWQYILPHLEYLSPTSDDLHVNDQAALTSIVGSFGTSYNLINIWGYIHHKVGTILGDQHIQTSRAALHLAEAYGRIGGRRKMEEMQRRAVELRSSLLGANHLETAFAMADLARTLKAGGKYAEASRLEARVLQIRRKSIDHPRSVVSALCELAITHRSQAKYTEAITLLKEALQVLGLGMGRLHIATLAVMETLSACYALHGDINNVEGLTKEMHALTRKLDGLRYVVVLRDMDSTADSFFTQGAYSQAESKWREVLLGRQEILGECHEDTLHVLFWLARAVFEQGKHVGAEELWREEIATRRRLKDTADAETLRAMHWLARSLYAQKRNDESIEWWQKVVSGRRRIYGDIHPHTLDSINWQAAVVFEQKRYAEAEDLRKLELSISRKLMGEQHSYTLTITSGLARTVYEQGRYLDAADMWTEEVATRRAIHGAEDRGAERAMSWLRQAVEKHESSLELANAPNPPQDGSLTTFLPFLSMPQPQRSYEWFQRFQQSINSAAILPPSTSSPRPAQNRTVRKSQKDCDIDF